MTSVAIMNIYIHKTLEYFFRSHLYFISMHSNDIMRKMMTLWMTMNDSDGNDEEVALGGSLNQSWSAPSHQSSPEGRAREKP